jgi:hypothetical protein
MFVQVIQGRAKDAAGLRKQADKWQSDIKPGAVGYLGATGGVTPDGEFIMCARFESEDAARRNSDRPEQGEWWSETEKYIEGATFHDCTKVTDFLKGGSDDAGFVQIMQYKVTNPTRLAELNEQFDDDQMAKYRPDMIGGYSAEHADGSTTSVNYYTSEAEARKGEAKEPPEEMKATFAEWMSLLGDIKYFDLPEPWLFSK